MRFVETIAAHLSLERAGGPEAIEAELVRLDYARELTVKQQSLAEFWHRHRLPLDPPPILPSPLPRHYRTTSKRRVLHSRGRVRLVFAEGKPARGSGRADPARLEPREHGAIYALVEERLGGPRFEGLRGAINYVIVKGSYAERAVIFNVGSPGPTLVRALRALAERITAEDRSVVSAFMFAGPAGSPYYLDSKHEPGSFKVKRLLGRPSILLRTCGMRYLVPPVVFSQVNESVLPAMLETVKSLLEPSRDQHLLDLYCGYGLFTHFLAPWYAHAVGLESDPRAVAAAEHNTRFLPPGAAAEFRVCRIDTSSFTRTLPRRCHREALLTDPPRQGMPPEAVDAAARRSPIKVVHACCGTDEIPRQIHSWEQNGYRLCAVRVLDMFPGTPHLETLLLLKPARSGAVD